MSFSARPSNSPCDSNHPFPEIGSECERGYKCSSGAKVQVPCEPGTYQNQTQQSDCLICPRGFFCPLLTIDPQPCPPGYECPQGSTYAYETPCEPGTYNRYEIII